MWRTQSLFSTPERRQLAGEWSHVWFTSLPRADEPKLLHHALDRPLPFADDTFDAIYSFHVVEHLAPAANQRVLRDLHRILRPGGVCRVSTPDLEFFASDYLQRVREQASAPTPENFARFQWAVCNLIDQAVRQTPGGEMVAAIHRREFTPEHVKHLNGDSLDFLFRPSAPPPRPAGRFASLLVDGSPTTSLSFFLRRGLAGLRRRFALRGSPARKLALEHERNLWLFDRVSLPRLFEQCGFADVAPRDHRSSGIAHWERYNFDQSPHGPHPLEPSLYVEGVKPLAAR